MTVPRTMRTISAALPAIHRRAFLRHIESADLLDPIAIRGIVDHYRQIIADRAAPVNTLSAPTPPPASAPPPDIANGVPGYVQSLRELKAWSGRSLRQLDRQARVAGSFELSSSSLSDALRSDRLPRMALLTAFTQACGLTPEQSAQWLDARGRLAAIELETN